jgi:hypothetical protein
MKETLLTAGAGELAILTTGALPTPDDVQTIGQLVIQSIIAIVTLVKLLRDRKKK